MRNIRLLVVLTAVAAAGASCGTVARQGLSPVFLVMDSLVGGPNNVNPVSSDVITKGSIIADNGQALVRAELKDPTSLTAPTVINDVTITRYHVSYRRSDGRNAPGIDVPFAFDGATTVTIPIGGQASVPFELVRAVAKQETPLVNLVTSATVVTTIAEVTFYGFDQAGNTVTISGLITIDFANFGDS